MSIMERTPIIMYIQMQNADYTDLCGRRHFASEGSGGDESHEILFDL